MKDIFGHSEIHINGELQTLVLKEHVIMDGAVLPINENSFLSPTVLMWIIFFITALLTLFQIPVLTKSWDAIILLFFSLLGILIIFLWFFTEHTSMMVNLNILWLNPIHLIFIISMLLKKLHYKFNRLYLAMAIFYFALIIGFMLIPQEFHTGFTPLIVLLAMKYFYWYKQTKKEAIKA